MRQAVGITSHDEAAMNVNSAHAIADISSVGRRRSQRACKMCYRRKTKCELDGVSSVCVQCVRCSTPCVFNARDMREKDDDSDMQQDQYVASLKDRLEKVESLLKAAGILHEGVQGDLYDEQDELPDEEWETAHERAQSLGKSSINSSVSHSSSDRERDFFPESGDVEIAPIFKSHERDDSRYFGRSCSLSILSRGGIEWIKSKTGDVSFLSLLSRDSIHDSPWNQWRPDVFHDLFASRVYKPLPPRSEVFSLIKDFFRTANRLFPIYHEASFMEMVEWQYTQQTCDDAARWASINMTICLAYEYRFSNSSKPEKDREKARFYFKNAMSVFTELALRRTDLLSVQALLSMAFFLRGNSGTQSALPFITAAMRSCQRMGLHRDIQRPDLSPVEREQRRRVFWVAFTVDQSTCLRAGSAPSQHPDDFDVPLPEDLEDNNDPDQLSNIPFFRQLCRMSVIKSRIFCRLYSAKALLKPPREIFRVVKELNAELEEWKKDYPFDEVPKQKVAEKDFLFGFASVGLHFVYYNAQIMIHRIPLLLDYLMPFKDEPEELVRLSKAQAASSALVCVKAARNTLKLVNNMPWGDIAWIWSLLYYVFLAAATIFSGILRNIRNPDVHKDLQSLNMAATFFATLVPGDGPANYAGFMTRMSANLERIARMAVEKSEKRARSPDDGEQDYHQSNTKRHHRKASTANRARSSRHQSSALRSSKTTDSTGPNQHLHTTAPSATTSSTANNPQRINIGIPEFIEGLPPINSSGYVVPMSPVDTGDYPSSTLYTQQPPTITPNYPMGLGLRNIDSSNTTNDFAPNTLPSWHFAQDARTHAASSLDNTQSPFSQNSGSTPTGTMFPDSWQVPLTADWHFGDNLWAGLIPSESIAASASQPNVSLPILNAESFLEVPAGTGNDPQPSYPPAEVEYGNSFVPGPGPQDQSQDSAESIWPNGFLGLF
ncbi:hypothetical protein N7462_010144 [Penicillium macrosclerotiorum]|uniref:uncharacterized protein n=1 Tax=Penicillium macrosclerotiorum TaxID=303699 RepID=UPI0025494C18|nr:uncharacterized protein N7462_010144 [Penicillium macrosclerotiorum]KAJ5669074.1 hypothetical protein N7462_010144 [Penicillium macrosclerotiorum]